MMEDLTPTKLDYYSDMWKLQSKANLISYFLGEDGRRALILESTIFHPQGGGQPSDTGFITISADSDSKFVVQDVRSRDGIVFHYGFVENSGEEFELKLEKGIAVFLYVDELRRKLNSRLHSAGHLLDVCIRNVGLGHLEPGKGYHFPDGPFVEYKGTAPQNELESKQKELELEANKLISRGGKVSAVTLPYEEASELCGGSLPDYIPKESTPRILKLGDNPGCPCGGTHVSDISEIMSVKVSQIRTKKGLTKVFYSVGS
uniref:Alanyl-transfer RNA synthetases family profile domain-containing protein n=1 Tax=Davidia involucrata TaxID=16924 RepID=A0A5B7BX70_DAVIN